MPKQIKTPKQRKIVISTEFVTKTWHESKIMEKSCFLKLLDAKIEFSKQGYKTQIVKLPTDVYLEKE